MKEENLSKNIPQVNYPQQATSGLPGAVAILEESLAIYKDRFVTLLGIMLAPTLGSIVVTFITAGLGVTTLKDSIGPMPFGLIFGSLSLLVLLTVFIIFFIQSWGYLALIYAIKDRKERINLREAYKRSFSKLMPYWWVSFLVTVIAAVGFMLLIVPGIIFSVWYGFSLFVLVNEDLKGFKALSKSKSYVSGRFLAVSSKLFVIGIIGIILLIISSLIFGKFGGQIVSFFFGPLAIIYFFLLYEYFRNKKSA